MLVLCFGSFEVCRGSRLISTQVLFVVGMTRDILTGEGVGRNGDLGEALWNYKVLQQIHHRIDKPLSHLIHVLYQTGTFLMVMGLTGTILGFSHSSIVSPEMHLISMFATGIVIIFVAVSVPVAVFVYEESDTIINGWKSSIYKFKNGKPGLIRRELRSVRPIGFPVGAKGILDKQNAMDLYERMIMNTQDLTLVLAHLG